MDHNTTIKSELSSSAEERAKGGTIDLDLERDESFVITNNIQTGGWGEGITGVASGIQSKRKRSCLNWRTALVIVALLVTAALVTCFQLTGSSKSGARTADDVGEIDLRASHMVADSNWTSTCPGKRVYLLDGVESSLSFVYNRDAVPPLFTDTCNGLVKREMTLPSYGFDRWVDFPYNVVVTDLGVAVVWLTCDTSFDYDHLCANGRISQKLDGIGEMGQSCVADFYNRQIYEGYTTAEELDIRCRHRRLQDNLPEMVVGIRPPANYAPRRQTVVSATFIQDGKKPVPMSNSNRTHIFDGERYVPLEQTPLRFNGYATVVDYDFKRCDENTPPSDMCTEGREKHTLEDGSPSQSCAAWEWRVLAREDITKANEMWEENCES